MQSMYISGGMNSVQSPTKHEIVFDPSVSEDLQTYSPVVPQTQSPPPKPTGITRPSHWDEHVEEAFRFQTAGYRDVMEYCHVQSCSDGEVKRWPHNNYIKMLKSRTGAFIYFNKTRECMDKDIHKCKVFNYNEENKK